MAVRVAVRQGGDSGEARFGDGGSGGHWRGMAFTGPVLHVDCLRLGNPICFDYCTSLLLVGEHGSATASIHRWRVASKWVSTDRTQTSGTQAQRLKAKGTLSND